MNFIFVLVLICLMRDSESVAGSNILAGNDPEQKYITVEDPMLNNG
jgi:hypothetical protein